MFLPLGNIKNKFKFEKAILKPASLCVPGSCLFTARFLRDVIKHLNNPSEALEERDRLSARNKDNSAPQDNQGIYLKLLEAGCSS